MDRLNADLANGLGNLASRTLSMLQRYRKGVVPAATVLDALDQEVLEAGRAVAPAYLALAEANDFHAGLERLWVYLRQMDGYIVKAEPWKLAKDEAGQAKLDTVLCQLYRSLRLTAVLVAPVMPELAQKLWEGLGLAGKVADQKFADFQFEAPAPGPVAEPSPLFQRIDKEAVRNEDEPTASAPVEAAPAVLAAAPAVVAPAAPAGEAKAAPVAAAAEAKPAAGEEDMPPVKEVIDYDAFALVDLRVGLVLTAERVPKSKKLIKMTVDIGLEVRTILGGIGTAYEPEQLVNRKVVVVANLAPRPMMGSVSHGMLLAASDANSKPYLVAPPEDARPGFVVR
jgi:methionyl-tRNA synthetase